MNITPEEDAEIEETTWQWFATGHPIEAYATWPERFWTLFHAKYPDISREAMERAMREAEDEVGSGK